MNVILCGYNWTGCKALQLLLDEGHKVFVYTHESPYHIPSLIDLCIEKHVEYSLENINKSRLPFVPNVICSIYYRYIISDEVISSCDGKIFNLHPALLPKYRGCSSLTWALINGESRVGFTYHYITQKVDSGSIILQKEVKVEDFDNQGTLYNRVMFQSMHFFMEVINRVNDGISGTDQKGESSYYKRGCPHNGTIDPDWDSETVKRFIRAMIHPPYLRARFKEIEISTFQEYMDVKQGSRSK